MDDKPKEGKHSNHLNRYIMVEEDKREILDAMHHIPNFAKQVFRYMNNGAMDNRQMRMELNAFFFPMIRHLCGDNYSSGMDPASMYDIPEAVILHARKRINELKKNPKCPSWLKWDSISEKGFAKMRNHDDIVMVFSFFDYIFQDSMSVPFIYASKQCFDCLSFLYTCTNNLNEAAEVQSILDFFLDFLHTITYITFGNISIHNAKHYWDTLLRAGPLKESDCFYNERSLKDAKGQSIASPNPSLTSMIRMIIYEYCLILCSSLEKVVDSVELVSPTMMLASEEDKKVVMENFIDDWEAFKDDRIPHPTYVDSVLEGTTWMPRIPNHTVHIGSTKQMCSTVYFRDRKYLSTQIPSGSVDTTWLMNNSFAISFTKTYRGRIQLFLVSGYTSYCVNDHSYVQALCHPLNSSSCSSFVDTPFKRLLPEKVVIPKDPIPISLYRLHFGEVFPMKYVKGPLTVSITTLALSQWAPWKHDLLFHRSYNKTTSKRSHYAVCYDMPLVSDLVL